MNIFFAHLVWFHGISIIEGYLMPNPLYTYIKYMIWKQNLLITFLDKPEVFFCTQLNGFKYFYQIVNHLFAQS